MSDDLNQDNVEEPEGVEPEAIEEGTTDEDAESPVATPDLEDIADAPSAQAAEELEDEAEDAMIASEAQTAAEVVAEAEADTAAAAAEVDEDAEISADPEDAPLAETPGQTTTRRGRTVPTRRRDQKRDPNAPKPVVRAQAKYVRSSARKARLVCDNFRGKSVEEARAILAVTPRHVARDWSKLLESAVANAEHNHELVGEDLVIKSVQADEGPTIKRFRPRAQGRATRIRKRTSHLTILLTPKD
jgi:ribosomal protein L22